MAELLVLWDVDYTLVNADGLGTRLYEVVFREMFGRELTAVAPKAGRTDRAIARDTLELSGIAAPTAQVDGFLAALGRLAGSDGAVSDGAVSDGAGPGGVPPVPAQVVAAALATGARVVGVATGSYQLEDLRRAGAHTVLSDLNDTARVVAAITG